MSFGGPEPSMSRALDPTFTTPAGHAGVTFVAATGDNGSPGGFPAYSPNVLAVGGTTLTLDSSNNISSETGWSGSGGGISQFEPQPSYQQGVVTQSTTQRTIPDVAFDADPNTGVPVYDSFNNGTSTPWEQVGGTSFSCPSWAAIISIADQVVPNGRPEPSLMGPAETLPKLYSLPAGDFNDLSSGNNGVCRPAQATTWSPGAAPPKPTLSSRTWSPSTSALATSRSSKGTPA